MKATKKIVIKKRIRIESKVCRQLVVILMSNTIIPASHRRKMIINFKKKYIHILKSNFCPNCFKILRVICRASLLQSVNSRYVFIFLTLQYLPFIGHKKSVVFMPFLFYRLAKQMAAINLKSSESLNVPR